MRVPHTRHKTPDRNRIPIDTAAAAAAALPFPSRREGAKWRTRGLCHGHADKPDSASLIFHDSEHEGGQLAVWCYKCQPRTAAERDRIRHALQEATGLNLCRCDACWSAWRSGQPQNRPGPAPIPANKDAERRSKRKSGQNRGVDSAEYAAWLWEGAQASTTGPAPDHPPGKWVRRFGVWPDGEPLPDGVRWLARARWDRIARAAGRSTHPDSTAAGALVLAMRPLSDPAAPVRKVQLVAIDQDGGKTLHWPDKRGDKRTWGQAPEAVGILTHWPHVEDLTGYDLHVVEGLKDGLAVLAGLPYEEHTGSAAAAWRYARAGYVAVAVAGGRGYRGIDPGPFGSVTLWPDADDPDALPSARGQVQRWLDQGIGKIAIELLPAGYDPAAITEKRSAE